LAIVLLDGARLEVVRLTNIADVREGREAAVLCGKRVSIIRMWTDVREGREAAVLCGKRVSIIRMWTDVREGREAAVLCGKRVSIIRMWSGGVVPSFIVAAAGILLQ